MSEDPRKRYQPASLRDRLPRWHVDHAKVAASTNDWAREAFASGATRVPALFVADSQSGGRGRGTNTWWSAIGNVTATWALFPNPHIGFGLVPLLAGLAVRRALVLVTGCDEIGLKWPNDLVVGPRKAAGLLCERLQHVDLIGVGVNVNAPSGTAPVELHERIISLRELTGRSWDLGDVVCEISRQLHRVLSVESASAASEALKEYSDHHWLTGRTIEVRDTDRAARIAGRCLGIDPEGRLIVDTHQGVRSLLTGSIDSVGNGQ